MKKNDKKEILNAINKLSGKIDIMKEQVAKIPEIEKQVAKIPGIEKQVAKIPGMENEISQISKMQNEILQIKDETRNISRSVTIIEHEHGDKIKAMFDALIVNNEKIYQEQERISFCERKIENHDNEIYYLKSKVQGL